MKLKNPIKYEELDKKTVFEFYDGPEIKPEDLAYYLPQYVKDHLTPSKNNMYVCPYCGSGTGKNGTGAFSVIPENPRKYKCFACDKTGDIFDLIGQVEGITDFPQQKKRVMDLYAPAMRNTGGAKIQRPTEPAPLEKSPKITAEERKALEEYFNKCHANLNVNAWRGISRATLDAFNVGYDLAWRHPKAPLTAPTSARIIIPTGGGSYIARSIDEDAKEGRYYDIGEKQLYNNRALITAKTPVFIVEGEIDALSIIDAGGEAVALGGTSGTNKLLSLLAEERPAEKLIIALDNDEAGKKATAELVTALNGLKIAYLVVDVYGDYKDANEALQEDREALEDKIKNVEDLARRDYVKEKSVAGYMDTYINRLRYPAKVIPTGFTKLDTRLGGGLSAGLVVIGAVSSLGKTTFLIHVADNMTAAGADVLYFSLEMSKAEIITKSLSRLTYIRSLEKYGSAQYAKDTRTIMLGATKFNETEIGLFNDCLKEYEREHASRMYIIEGDDGEAGEMTIDGLYKRAQDHIEKTGHTPVIVVDYLQILPPAKDKMSDTEAVRYNVKKLKDISRDLDTPVIVISSFNRANYKTVGDMESFKQSGGIEYSADLLFTMEFNGVGTEGFNLKEAKCKNPREVLLKPLKNRNGGINWAAPFYYNPIYNYFQEADKTFTIGRPEK